MAKEKWFKPSTHSGWEKGMPATERRRLVLKAHKGEPLASGRAMQALANVTTDKRTRELANADAKYFFRQLKTRSRVSKRRTPRITPKMPRLRR